MSIKKTKEMIWLAISNLRCLTIKSLLLGWLFRVVSHSTKASKNFANIIWTKGQLQGFLRRRLSWNSVVVINLPQVCNLIEKEVYCRRVPLKELNFLKELFYEHPKWADSETISCSNQQLRQKNNRCHYAKFEKVTELYRK